MGGFGAIKCQRWNVYARNALRAVNMNGEAATEMEDAVVNCSALVMPRDISPKRSPQAVHSLLSLIFRDRDVVEGGTRWGDGVMCWGRAAKSVVGMEIDSHYCASLVRRAAAEPTMSSKLGMVCRSFFDQTPDADVYTWWAQPPQMTTTGVLSHLVALHRNARIRASAEAVFLLEAHEKQDEVEYRKWRQFASWRRDVRYDERRSCEAFPSPAVRNSYLCSRAAGTMHVLGVRIDSLANNSRAQHLLMTNVSL